MRSTLLALITIIIMSTAGFSMAKSEDKVRDNVVFDCYHYDGASIAGFYINSEGELYEYKTDCGEDLSYWDLSKTKTGVITRAFSSAALSKKTKNARLRMGVNITVLTQKMLKIPSAGHGSISRRTGGSLKGWKGCLAYTIDSDTGSYQGVNLGSEGRYFEINDSTDAKMLRSWLDEFWTPESIPTGTYFNKHIIVDYLDDRGPVEKTAVDTLEIHKIDDTHYGFSFFLIFSNYHTCDMSGVAEVDSGGLEYRTVAYLGDKPDVCKLRIEFGKDIRLQSTQVCRSMYCGMRGGINGTTFPGKPRVK